MIVLGALLGAAMGLILGTYVPPNRISVTFTLVLTPLIFTGSSQYPWPSLGHIRWFQVVSALNPMTYVSEGLRGLMAPERPPHPDLDLLCGGHRGPRRAHDRGDGRLQAAGPRLTDPAGRPGLTGFGIAVDRPLRCQHGRQDGWRNGMSDDDLWGLVDPAVLASIVVVSPHFDDAALGAAHLLTSHPGSTVITVLGRATPGLPRGGHALGRGRRLQDRATTWWQSGGRRTGAAMASMGAMPVWLDFPDHQYLRRDQRPTPARGRARARLGPSPRPGPVRCSCPWGWPIPTMS